MPRAVGGMVMEREYIACECGNEVPFSENYGRVESKCGRRYAVTITQTSL